MRKIILYLWIIAFFVVFLYGKHIKSTFTYKILNTNEEKFNTVQNSYYKENEYIPKNEIKTSTEEIFNSSSLISKVRYIGKSDYANNEVIFHCEVCEVYKGDNTIIGTQIQYVVDPMALDLNFGFAWGSYVNYMKQDEEYLIFANKVNTEMKSLPDNIYCSSGLRYAQYFSFREHNDIIIKLEPLKTKGYEEYYGFYARDYSENEFFASTYNALENFKMIKEAIFTKIQEYK